MNTKQLVICYKIQLLSNHLVLPPDEKVNNRTPD